MTTCWPSAVQAQFMLFALMDKDLGGGNNNNGNKANDNYDKKKLNRKQKQHNDCND